MANVINDDSNNSPTGTDGDDEIFGGAPQGSRPPQHSCKQACASDLKLPEAERVGMNLSGTPNQALQPTSDRLHEPEPSGERPVTTTDLLKFFGVAFFLLDHYGFFFDYDQDWWRVFGRNAAPIFFFFVGLAQTKRVPWSWLILGVILTMTEAWTEDFKTFTLNILLNFALIRLALPMVERHVMPFPARIALLALGAILLIRPVEGLVEYGAEGWLWALFGLAHRLAIESATPRALWARNVLAILVASTYVITEIRDYEFEGATATTLILCVAVLTATLALFRRTNLSQQPRQPVATLLRFAGRYSLEIYAITLFVFFVTKGTEIIDYGFEGATATILILCVAVLTATLALFRRTNLSQQPRQLHTTSR